MLTPSFDPADAGFTKEVLEFATGGGEHQGMTWKRLEIKDIAETDITDRCLRI